MKVACLDLEGTLAPEIWEKIAEETGIEELGLTTRDIPDFERLMNHRFEHLRKNGIDLERIGEIVRGLEPYTGAVDFVKWLEKHAQIVVITGSFYEFIPSIREKLGNPLVIANNLRVDESGCPASFFDRVDCKARFVKLFRNLNMDTLAVGDSFNDGDMLKEADKGVFFDPPEEIRNRYPEVPAVADYRELKEEVEDWL